jgi:hypothetical protein
MFDGNLPGKMSTVARLTRPAACLFALAAILLAGCGYHFAGEGSNLPRDAKTIYVSKFTNHTRVTGVNDEFMQYLDDEIASRKRLTLVDNPHDADLELSGDVAMNLSIPNAFNSVNEPTQYAETIIVHAALRDTRTNRIIWTVHQIGDTETAAVVSQTVVQTTPTFLQQNLRASNISAMSDIQVAQTQQRYASNLAMANLAKHMYDSMASGF